MTSVTPNDVFPRFLHYLSQENVKAGVASPAALGVCLISSRIKSAHVFHTNVPQKEKMVSNYLHMSHSSQRL